VVVSQLVRSPGVYFDRNPDLTTGKLLAGAKLIPNRGRLARVRDVEPRRALRQGRPQAQDAGDDLLRAIGLESDETCWRPLPTSTPTRTGRFIATTLTRSRPRRGTRR
jgi:DNA-directed RNA polymerase beta subunit